MPDLAEGEEIEVEGSGSNRYTLANDGGVYSCTCPAWRFQSRAIDARTCKHLRAYRGDALETARVGAAARQPARAPRAAGSAGGAAGERPSVGVAPKLLLAHSWDFRQDLSGWWMSEKLDGVRAYWDGAQFVSRQGNVFLAPEWFRDGFPDEPLDGELWVGRGEFQRTVSIVRRVDAGEAWREVRYLVFDAPDTEGVFEVRFERVKRVVAALPEHVHAVAHSPCQGREQLLGELERVEALGGEGLMLRQPGSLYRRGRSGTCLKVKTFHDAEGRVVGHLPGAGRHLGRLGALELELPDGTRFSVGTGFSDAQREAPPAPGALVTFRFQELTNAGVPRFPSFVAERSDIAWEQVRWPPSAMPAIPSAAERSRLPVEDLSRVVPAALGEVEEVSRQLQFEKGRTAKFWEIEQDGRELTITYGRVGKEPKVKTETLRNARLAAERANALAEAKLEKGYEEF